jgi:enoyl-CoA hydratase
MTGAVANAAANCEFVDVAVCDRVEHVATVTVERPDTRNAMSAQVRRELLSVLDTIEATNEILVVVLTGSEKTSSFIAGGDIAELRERNTVDQRKAGRQPRIYEVVANHRNPVIARINGHALGGGCELAQACDVRIALAGSKLGQPEINLGIIPGGGGTQRLTRLVGEGQAMRLVLSGEVIDAEEAAEIGLVEETHDEETFDERVYELAGSIASKSPIAVRNGKKAVKENAEVPLSSGLEYEYALLLQLFETADKNEGMDAFLENREPEWEGR